MLEIEIDGKPVQVRDGCTVMEAATSVGCYIPHFCYHKKLSIAANCRMCLVQVEKAPKPLPACATPVTAGMKVWTRSAQALTAQKGVMEFLLINHPLDCPICDQGGECQLQDLAVGYGSSQSRYEEEKRVVVDKNLGPLVSTEMTRCINCTRCVRFTDEIAGEMELGQAFRGEHAEIMPFLEKTVDSELSGNIIDLCPVGALTSKPFRFSARTWEMSRRKTVSPHDSLGSNLIVQTKHDRVKRVLPLENEALNECWISDKDRFSYEALNGEQRLTRPMMRIAGRWQEVDWQVALEFIAKELHVIVSESGPDALAAMASPQATVEELYLLQKLVRSLGSDNVDVRLRQIDFRADGKRRGAPWLGMPVAEIGDLNRLLIVGSFLRKDHPLVAQRVRRAARRGLKVNVIGASAEDWRIPVVNRSLVAPSAMVTELAGVVKALAELTEQSLAAELLVNPPQEVSPSARAIAESLASGQRVAVWLGNHAQQHPRAAELEVLANEIARLTQGRSGVLGEGANSVGAWLAGAVPQQGGNAAQFLSAPRAAYLVLHADPELDCHDGLQAITAMQEARMVVLMSPFLPISEAMSGVANVLLPVAPFTETSGTFVNCEGRAQSFHAVAPPLQDTRPAWKVLRVLGNLLGLEGFSYDDSKAVLAELKLDKDLSRSLDGRIDGVQVDAKPVISDMLERVADVPIHFADPLVRRAPALQRTQDAQLPSLRASSATLESRQLAAGERVRARMQGVEGKSEVELEVVVDEQVARGCARVAGAHLSVMRLGALSGELIVERV